MRWRHYILLALLVSEGSAATASESVSPADAVLELDAAQGLDEGRDRVVLVNIPDAVVATEPTETVEPVVAASQDELALETVTWTVGVSLPLPILAQTWGTTANALAELNPELTEVAVVQSGTAVKVFAAASDKPTQSVGMPNRGRLRNGIPMPEGEYWRLRDRRIRAYGAEGTIRSLVSAFTAYGQAHPDGPPIHLGEISYRKGGRAWPHVSHRTGRDADIGYVMKPGTLGKRHWKRADENTLDAAKTWTLIKALGDTGRVQRIFISSKLQRVLKAYAATVVDEQELAKYFRIPGLGAKQRYLITHENGHRDHLHVRFRCDPEDRRCHGHGLFPIEPPPPAAAGRTTVAAP